MDTREPEICDPSIPDLLIVDWSNLIHRTFHGLGADPEITVRDLCLIAEQNIREMARGILYEGWRMVIVLDGGYSGRKEIYGGYKSGRTPTDERPPSLVAALASPTNDQRERMTVVQMWGFEADDVMAALANEHVGNAFILSNDRDLLQAVSDHIFLLVPKGPFDAPDLFGPDDVQEHYGFPPSLIPQYKALQGDTTDNVPSIPGVGHGRAKKLICDYGSIEGAIQAALSGLLTPVLTKTLVLNRHTIALNLRLVTFVEVPGIDSIYRQMMDILS